MDEFQVEQIINVLERIALALEQANGVAIMASRTNGEIAAQAFQHLGIDIEGA